MLKPGVMFLAKNTPFTICLSDLLLVYLCKYVLTIDDIVVTMDDVMVLHIGFVGFVEEQQEGKKKR